MANDVFANGREISCKAADGKSISAFPDVCFTPPQTPATPPGVPTPYPNTAFAKDATKGSKKVKISNKEVMLKNKSYFKTSTGDEAGCAPKKGIVTSKTKGKAYFTSWSMDVKVEGENVVRHLDLTTHNHASYPSNSPTWPYADAAAFKSGGPCDGVDEQYALKPYNRGCEDGKTPHHIIPDRQMFHGTGSKRFKRYTHGSAPCICVTGRNQHSGEHRLYHEVVDTAEHDAFKSNAKYTYSDSKAASCDSMAEANNLKDPEAQKVKQCTEHQLDNYYKERCGANNESPLRASGSRGKRLRPESTMGSVGVPA